LNSVEAEVSVIGMESNVCDNFFKLETRPSTKVELIILMLQSNQLKSAQHSLGFFHEAALEMLG